MAFPDSEYTIIDSEVDPSARISAEAIVEGSVVGPNVVIEYRAYLCAANVGKDAHIMEYAAVAASVGENTVVGVDARVENHVGKNCRIGAGAIVYGQVGDNCEIGESAIVYASLPDGAWIAPHSRITMPTRRAYHMTFPRGDYLINITLMDDHAYIDGGTHSYQEWDEKLPKDSPIRLIFAAYNKL